jgi:hypothetical protein
MGTQYTIDVDSTYDITIDTRNVDVGMGKIGK